jgi:uncharacterized membrane protein
VQWLQRLRDRTAPHWDRVRSNLWLVPTVMSLGALTVAQMLTHWGPAIPISKDHWIFYSGNFEGARALLSALLTGMVTMTSLVVSITLLVLTLAANQLGGRVIRTFIRDGQVHAVLGLFVATVVYLIAVLRKLDEASLPDVPHLAMTLAVLLGVLSLLALLFYVNKLANAIMHDVVVADVMQEAFADVERLLPEQTEVPEAVIAAMPDGTWIRASGDGYVEAIQVFQILHAVENARASVHIPVVPGDYVVRGAGIARLRADRHEAALSATIQRTIRLSAQRIPAEDLRYGIARLVEIGMRALSPSTHDPVTAIAVINALCSVLCRAVRRGEQQAVFRDRHQVPRVTRRTVRHAELIHAAFEQIRGPAAAYPWVARELVESITRIADQARTPEQRSALVEELAALEARARDALSERDLTVLLARIRASDLLGTTG